MAFCMKINDTRLKSKTPIIPVVLYDSYIPYNTFKMGKVKTQVHFLKPICYDEYKEMKTREVRWKIRLSSYSNVFYKR